MKLKIILLIVPLLCVSSGTLLAHRCFKGITEDISVEAVGNTHPRLYFSKKDFRSLRRTTFGHCGNRYVRNISAGIIKAADSLAMHGDYPYRKDASGRRILENCSRPVLRCLSQTAYAYKITGEKKYLDRAISLLETVCAYPDWNPRHYLDVAELALGVALAYDWLYWEISSELRDRVEDKLIHEALETSLESKFTKWCYEVNNRNQVCNAGLAIAALAVWEKAPTLCRDVLESSIARNRLAMASLYAPDGIYAEGAVYWSYGTTFEVCLLDALESVLGTDYGLSEAPGFDRTPYFEMNMFSSTGREEDYFNYADSEDALSLPGCIWYFVRRSGDSGFLWPAREKYEQPLQLYDDRLAFITLYEAVHAQIKKIAEPEAAPFFGDGPTPLAVLRTGWNKDDLYLAVKGGSASSSHAHMDAGSFVFDAYGTRWACDPPRPSYAATEKWWKDNGLKRSEVIWDFFSYRNTSHNTLTVNGKKHSIRGKAHLVKCIDSLDYQGASIDMGEIFAEDLSYAERTVAIVNRCRLEVVDVLETGAAPAHIRWNWVTPAAVTLCPDGILLSKDGVEMKLSSADTSIPLHWRIWPLNKDTIGLDPEDFLPCAKGLSIVGFECDIPATTKVTLKTVCEKLRTQVALSSFKDLPKDISVETIGNRVAEQLLASDPLDYGNNLPGYQAPYNYGKGKEMNYSVVSLWVNALEFAHRANNRELENRLIEFFEPFYGERASLRNRDNHVDYSIFGAIPLEIYLISGDKRALDLGLRYADHQWEDPTGEPGQKVGGNGNFPIERQREYLADGYSPQTRLWIDDMYMITVLQAQAYRATGDRKYIDRAAREMKMYMDSLQRENGLFYHAQTAPYSWGRGNGWMAAGLPMLLSYLPEDSEYRPALTEAYLRMMPTLLKYQHENGMWGQVVDDPEFWDESSCTAMFAYAFVEGVSLGLLDEATYGPAARKAWVSLCGMLDEHANLAEVCIGTGHKNSREHYMDRPRSNGDPHGQMAMMWLCSALLK